MSVALRISGDPPGLVKEGDGSLVLKVRLLGMIVCHD